jgi:ApaG protein
MSQAQITCRVEVKALPEQTAPDEGRWAYTYSVTIENTGSVPVQVVGRHWLISDSAGTIQEAKGLGVVGHQPYLQPGQRFNYTSWASIATPQGSMKGSYLCVTESAEVMQAEVPEFLLADTAQLH